MGNANETATHETKTAQGEQQPPTREPVTGRGAKQIEEMVKRGAQPPEVARVLAQWPEAREPVMTFLHQTVGNKFVQDLLAVPDFGNVLANGPQVMRADSGLDGKAGLQMLTMQVKGQWVLVYVSPGGISESPNVFMFFHGQRANLGVQPGLDKPRDNVSGADVAGAAMAEAKAKNTLAILPQGEDGIKGGGSMPAMESSGAKQEPGKDLPTFLDAILGEVGKQLGKDKPLSPANISIAGHSAGGYMGVHDALSTAGRYNEKITDVTLEDTSYSDVHFADAAKWMVSGPDNKSLRIIQGHGQMHDPVPVYKDKEKKQFDHNDPAHWANYFTEARIDAEAKAAGMTITKVLSPKGDLDGKKANERGAGNTLVQHTQILKDGKVHCDIQILASTLGHHEIRDSTIDDAIDNIGEGANGADRFGRNEIKGYGRDPSARHYGNSTGPYNDEDRRDQAEDAKLAREKKEREKQEQEQKKAQEANQPANQDNPAK